MAWGLATQRGVQLAIDDVNAKAGLKVGSMTYKFQLVMLDDAYSATDGRAAAERLVIAERVKYILRSIGFAVVPVTTKNKCSRLVQICTRYAQKSGTLAL
jgi:branched-chain amino acid transport system substrate-binding protein